MSVSVSSDFSFILDQEGKIWYSGTSNRYPHTSLNLFTKLSEEEIPQLFCEQISSRYQHVIIRDQNKQAWAWGYNTDGELGSLACDTIAVPSKVEGLPPIEFVHAAYCNSFYVDVSGNVWGCGYNVSGELGLGKKMVASVEQLTKIPRLLNVHSVSAAQFQSLFLDTDGNVWSCGENTVGQLGLGDTQSRHRVNKIENLPPIKSIYAESSHSVFIEYDGGVWACG